PCAEWRTRDRLGLSPVPEARQLIAQEFTPGIERLAAFPALKCWAIAFRASGTGARSLVLPSPLPRRVLREPTAGAAASAANLAAARRRRSRRVFVADPTR